MFESFMWMDRPGRSDLIDRTVQNYDKIMSKVTVATAAEQRAVEKTGNANGDVLAKSADAIASMKPEDQAADVQAVLKSMSTGEMGAIIAMLQKEMANRSPAEALSKALAVSYEGVRRHENAVATESLCETLRKVEFKQDLERIDHSLKEMEDKLHQRQKFTLKISDPELSGFQAWTPTKEGPGAVVQKADKMVISGLSISDMVEHNCKHDPNDTGFGFAYCKLCNTKMRRGPNLEWTPEHVLRRS